jgi:hypothetical protein
MTRERFRFHRLWIALQHGHPGHGKSGMIPGECGTHPGPALRSGGCHARSVAPASFPLSRQRRWCRWYVLDRGTPCPRVLQGVG